jgi:hypothetical protein
MSPLNPASTHSRHVFEIVTMMPDVPDKARHEMTVGARHRYFTLDRVLFRCQKAGSKSLPSPD